MTELFTRDGQPTPYRVTENDKGQPGFIRDRVCGRCGGAGGSDKWKHTGWTCFDCAGKGTRGTEFVRLYTREKLDALNATLAKRNATKLAAAQRKAAAQQAQAEARRAEFEAAFGALLAQAEPYAGRSEFLADVVAKARRTASLSEKQAEAIQRTVEKLAASDAARAASGHVGKPGMRITANVTVERVSSFERPSFNGYSGPEIVYIVAMRDDAGNMLVAKSPRFHAEKGDRLTIRATVKEHAEYRGEKQTLVQRIATAGA